MKVLEKNDLINKIDQYLKTLFPIQRSITGKGNRKTLQILKEVVPLEIKEYASGTEVFDWIIPDEWNISDAWIKDAYGNKIIDYKESNLHVVSYSERVHKTITFAKLKKRLHYHNELENAIPYVTSYYKRDWGFAVTKKQYEILSKINGPLEICIESKFNKNGSLSIGELVIPGTSDKEILLSTYICHPSLANDNLSGPVMTAFLAKQLMLLPKPKHSFRIIWVPETIGAISYLAMNQNIMNHIKTGLVITTVGGPGKFGYKQSHNKNHSINLAIENVFIEEGIEFIKYPFDMHGSDERQYSTQSFRFNMASITKDKYYEYPYYHTSLDNLDFISSENVYQSLILHLKVLMEIDAEPVYENQFPSCEVMLSKHNLYPHKGPHSPVGDTSDLDLILWLLWLCDGEMGLYQIKKRLGVPDSDLDRVINQLLDEKLILKK
tara:strand:- start:2863 stop:4173 length:1311 start_codon:yes stop_codon:yes gene_type:complete